jgi:hypothetical protein
MRRFLGLMKPAARIVESWCGVLAIALLVTLVLYQKWQMQHPVLVRPSLVAVGTQLPVLAVKNLAGQSAAVCWSAEPRPTIIYAFTPTCAWCKRNLAGIKEIAAQTPGYRFVGLSLTDKGLPEYVDANGLTFPAYSVSKDDKGIQQLKLSVTPTTIVVSREGKVQNVWPGAYSGKTREEVEKFFGLHLPSLGPAQALAE